MTALLATLALSPLAALKPLLDTDVRRFGGRMGYCVVDLRTGARIDARGQEIFPTASTIKTAVALEALMQVEEGKIKYTDKRPVPPMEGAKPPCGATSLKSAPRPTLMAGRTS